MMKLFLKDKIIDLEIILGGVILIYVLTFTLVFIVNKIAGSLVSGLGTLVVGILSVVISSFATMTWSKHKPMLWHVVLSAFLYSWVTLWISHKSFVDQVVERGLISVLVMLFLSPLPVVLIALFTGALAKLITNR